MSTTARTDFPRMTADEFIAWATEQRDAAHFELHHGEVVLMPNEAVGHNRVKMRIARLLEHAVSKLSQPCEAFGDGVSVIVDESIVFEPDVTVRDGPLLPDDAVKIVDPLIVVEVLSPSTRGYDMNTKLAGYLRIASLRHYLIVDPPALIIIHHEKAEDGTVTTRISAGETIRLDPPGIELSGVFD